MKFLGTKSSEIEGTFVESLKINWLIEKIKYKKIKSIWIHNPGKKHHNFWIIRNITWATLRNVNSITYGNRVRLIGDSLNLNYYKIWHDFVIFKKDNIVIF